MLSEEQAIEKLKKIREDTIKANECGLSNNDFKEEIEVYDVISNLITKLQKENEEKDKQIDLMAFNLADYVMYYEYDKCRNPEMIKNKAEEIKQYFGRRV